jgi:seryl-tRNA synthetase
MSEWKAAKKKLTKSQKKRAASLREEIEWLEETLYKRPQIIADEVDLIRDGDKLTVVRTENGRKDKLKTMLDEMKEELNGIYQQ